QHHFGAGLVDTPSDFGKLGNRPSHPELLDWLATEWVKHGWSLKWLHREILKTRAWRQSSRATSDDPDWNRRMEVDPGNHLNSRQRRMRLDGESLRDAMLAAAGQLNLKMGGPGVRPPLPPEVSAMLLKNQWPVTSDSSENHRRSLYLFARRNLRYPLFDVFDRPDANQSCAQRHVSTTAPQALTLMNDGFVHEMASELAMEEDTKAGDMGAKVTDLYLRTLGRVPTPEEESVAKDFLEGASLDDFCLALLNLSEFIYLD
ncbi:MAG: DUF1553 domain-containing protein, partial [Verrucomicrobiae bacterium]|nr:DUF1553 domain-containing protein [Verrucomicrobiae bacterium]